DDAIRSVKSRYAHSSRREPSPAWRSGPLCRPRLGRRRSRDETARETAHRLAQYRRHHALPEPTAAGQPEPRLDEGRERRRSVTEVLAKVLDDLGVQGERGQHVDEPEELQACLVTAQRAFEEAGCPSLAQRGGVTPPRRQLPPHGL